MTWSPGRTLKDMERQHIYEALAFYQNHKTRTAEALGICPNTLASRLAEYEGSKNGNGTEIGNGKETEAENKTSRESVEPRVSVESAPKVPAKQQMPLRKRAEV